MGRKRKNKGLGDIIENITEATGIKAVVKEVFGDDCGCEQRKEQLNKMFPFKKKINCFTEEQYIAWSEFKRNRTLRLTAEQVKFVCEIYAYIANVPYWYPECFNCSGTARTLSDMITRLDKVYESYEVTN